MLALLLIGGGLVLTGILIGNVWGDQLTLRDCALKGRAEMAGNGVIECRVVQSN
jgi:hypothetical protein